MSKTSKLSANGGNGQSRLVPFFVASAVVVFAFSGWAWWHSVRSNPERTLYAAIENNLRTRSVSRQVTQSGSGTQKLEQDVELLLSPKSVAHGSTTISQTGDVNATVKTESISTAKEEYVRYTDIETDQKNAKGEVVNFSELVNIWGKSADTGQPGELYGESILGIVPTGNLSARDRREVMKVARDDKVYEFNEKTLERKIQNGRPTYVYEVKVAPAAYIKLLKKFGAAVGLKQLEGLDPGQYESAEALNFKLTVDVWSQHLTGIEFAGGERTERTSGFGINHEVDMPKESIPVQELQAKLQKAQE